MTTAINNNHSTINNTETIKTSPKKEANPFDMDSTISARKPLPAKKTPIKGTLNDGWKPENTITSLSPKEEEESHRDPFADSAKRTVISPKQPKPAKVSKEQKNPFDI